MKKYLLLLPAFILLGGCSGKPSDNCSFREILNEEMIVKEDCKSGVEFRMSRKESPLSVSWGAFIDNKPVGIHLAQSLLVTTETYYDHHGEIYKVRQYDLAGRKVADCSIKGGKPVQGSLWSIYWGLSGVKESSIVFFKDGVEINSEPYRKEIYTDLVKGMALFWAGNASTKGIRIAKDPAPAFSGITTDEDHWQYTWQDDRLLKAVKGNITFEAKYDTIGRRIEKKIFKDRDLVKHQGFSYEADNLVGIYDLLKDKNVPVATFEWKNDNPSVLYTMTKDRKLYYYVIDHSNNVIALVNEDGESVAQYEYNPFNEALSSSGPMSSENPFLAECGFYDEETGLLLINTRYFNTRTIKWLDIKKEEI